MALGAPAHAHANAAVAIVLAAVLIAAIGLPPPSGIDVGPPGGPAVPVAASAGHGRIAVGDEHVCVLTPSGAADCWGGAEAAGHRGPFGQIVAGGLHTCGLTPSGAAECWGSDCSGESGRHPGLFVQLAAGRDHTCGSRLRPFAMAAAWPEVEIPADRDAARPARELRRAAGAPVDDAAP